MKVGELKAALKAAGMSTAGAKPALEKRLDLHKQCASNPSIRTATGENPCALSFATLKSVAAKEAQISPMLSHDEILEAFVAYLSATPAGSASAAAATAGAQSGKVDPNAVIAKVLALAELDEHAEILNLARGSGPVITSASPVAMMRKAYLKLSLVIHPDRNASNPDATKAFQGLATAFERLSQPEMYAEEDAGRGKKKKDAPKKIARSNLGCKRTRVRCPRCHVPWSESKIEGNPDYYYNFLMSGLKQYCCSTCLFEFGCMTAVHVCPFCSKNFEYSPQDYHRKIVCGNKGCDREFGFYEFPTSDRVITDIKRTVKEALERRAKTVEQKRRREKSSARRGVGAGVDLEEAFSLGLTDACPRCGEPMASFADEVEQRQHLRECTDTVKHAKHKQAQKAKKAKEAAGAAVANAQLDAESEATWRMLGGKTEQLWMLTEGSLSKQCEDVGVEADGLTKDEMIASIASTRGDGGLLRLGGGSAAAQGTGRSARGNAKRKKMTASSLPTNYYQMSLQELKSVLAAHGIVTKATNKADVLAEIEDDLTEDDAPLRLAGPTTAKATVVISEDDSDDDVILQIPKRRRKKGAR